MAIDVPGVLSLIGGTPIKKASGNVFINKLLAVKSLDGGSGNDDSGNQTGLGSMLSGIVNGSAPLSALLQNPMAGVGALLQGNLTNGAAAITAALGGAASGLVAAMTGGGGANAASASVLSLASTLSGVTPGTPGPLDLINHSTMLEQFGGTEPPVVSFANASAPVANSARMGNMSDQVVTMTANVISGTMSIANATAFVVAITAEMNSWVTASNLAFSTMQAALVSLAALNALGASIVSGSPALQAVVASIAQPGTLATLQASVAALSAEVGQADQTASANLTYYQSQDFLDAVQEGADT